MGYAGACYLVQEYCNALFDALFHILPLGTEMDRAAAATPVAQAAWNAQPWDEDALETLAGHVEHEPFLVRISAAKTLRDRIEREARDEREDRVTDERVRRTIAAVRGRVPA